MSSPNYVEQYSTMNTNSVNSTSLESIVSTLTIKDDSGDAFLGSPILEGLLLAIPCSTVMIFTIVGNILVIVSVFNYKPLRNTPNMYLVSLAVADITVATFVMPFNVTYSIMGRWIFGLHMCKVWLTCDVLCCTASILNLCAIALDRYQAIHDPINYAQKRTLQRVLTMIALIWLLSALISIPPLLGWNDWPEDFTEDTPCTLNQEKGYLIYSSSGSFFIPLIIMTVVYVKIFMATRRRLRERAKLQAGRISVKVKPTSSSGDAEAHQSTSSDNAITNDFTTAVANNNKNNLTKQFSVENSDSNDSHESQSEVTNDQSRSVTSSSRLNCTMEETAGSEAGICETNLSIIVKTGPTSMTLKPESAKKIRNNKGNKAKHSKTHKSTGSKLKAIAGHRGGPKIQREEPSSAVKQYWEEKQRISLSRERKAARVLGIVMGSFVACWLPFFLMYVVVPFCGDSCPGKFAPSSCAILCPS